MKVTMEITDVRDFTWWAGAKDVFQSLTYEQKEYLNSYLDCFEELTETQLNDWMWFDVPELLNEMEAE